MRRHLRPGRVPGAPAAGGRPPGVPGRGPPPGTPGRAPAAGRGPPAPGALPGRAPGTACGGRGAPGTPPGRAGALRGALTPNGLLPIRGGRGAPGTPPWTRGGRAGAPGVPEAAAAGRSVESAGRDGACADAAGAAVNVGPAEGTSTTGGCCGVTCRAGDGATEAAGRSATVGAGAGTTAAAGAAGVADSATTAAGLGALGAGRPGAPGREEVLRGAAVTAPPLPPPLLATAADAPLAPSDGAPLAGAAGAAVPAGATGNASRNLRTTGASMVDEALLTNSPNSLSLEMISLLDLPSSFASSCTRALPATALLTVRPGGKTARPRVSCTGSLLGLHGVLTTGRPAFGVFGAESDVVLGPAAATSVPARCTCSAD